MADDPTARPQPEYQQPVFIKPDGTLPGEPPAETPPGANAEWPARFAFIAIGLFVAALVVVGILAAIASAAGVDVEGSTFTIIGTLVQEAIFLVVAFLVARMAGPVALRDFGLRRFPFGPTFGKLIAVAVMYYVFLGVFAAAVDLKADDSPVKLGAEDGAVGMIAFAIVAALLAPVVEEIFFRGIIFRPLANGIGVWGAAIASGIFFGMLHWDFQTTERLMQVIPLTMLGVLLAILYAWSGTIFAPIAVHATNNGLAVAVYAGTHDSVAGVIAAVICWLALMVFCFYGPRLTDREPAVTPQVITA